jgi:competence protein ComEC
MIKAIRKRPFARPLLIWIAGILLATYYPCRICSFILLFVPACFLCASLLSRRQSELAYDARWIWGTMFACLLLFLSIQTTALRANGESLFQGRLLEWAERSRQRLLKPLEALRLTETEKSVLATLTLGYRAGVPKEVRRQFSVTGVAHILSVSGFHVAVVCSMLSLLLFPLAGHPAGRWVRYLLMLLLLWTFAAVSGLAVASVRAAVMLSLYLTGRQLRYTTDGYNTLAAAAFCMLAYNPHYLFDMGFQLSYAAVWSILYLQPRFDKRMEVKNPLLSVPCRWLTVTLSAQMGVTFLCLYYFGQFSTVFLLTNLPLTLIATLLIPVTFVWILLPAGFPGAALLQTAIETLTRSMMRIVEAFSRMPGGSVAFRFDFIATCLAYGALVCFLLYCDSRRPRLLIASMFLLLLMLITMIP